MTPSDDTWDFNKELIFGEVGSAMGAPLVGLIASFIRDDPSFISFMAVGGSLIGAALFWLFFRVKHEKRKGQFSREKLAQDVLHFTPVAFLIAILVYQPTLYFVSEHLLTLGIYVIPSILLAQAAAFALFLILVNLYRILLERYTGRIL